MLRVFVVQQRRATGRLGRIEIIEEDEDVDEDEEEEDKGKGKKGKAKGKGRLSLNDCLFFTSALLMDRWSIGVGKGTKRLHCWCGASKLPVEWV